MVPHLVRVQSTDKDIRIRSLYFHHALKKQNKSFYFFMRVNNITNIKGTSATLP